MSVESTSHERNLSTDGDCSVFSVTGFGSSILEQLNRMRLSEVLIDVIISAEGKEFPCHRVVLAANSQYFKAMFSYGLRESHERRVPIQGVSSDVMQMVIEFAYTGQCSLQKQYVAEVMMAADLFQILRLKEAAVEFLMSCVDVNNCLLIRRLAEDHSCYELSLKSRDYARAHFSEVVLQEEFIELDLRDLISYLADDDLLVSKEDVVFDAAIRWLQHSPEREKYASHVLEAVRLPFVSPEYLKNKVAREPLVYKSNACSKQVFEARTFQVSGRFSEEFESVQRKPRRCTSKEVLIVFGGECRVGNFQECIQDVSYYDPSTGAWETLAMVPGTLHTQAFGAVSLGYDIFITGGAVDNEAVNDVRVFYTYLNKWCNVAPMIQARYHHSAAVVNGQVYVVGGTDGVHYLDHVERYNPAENKWYAVEPLVHAVKCPAVDEYGNKLYVFGGFGDRYIISQSVQVYDPRADSWIAISNSLIDYTCAHAVCVHGKFYLLGGCSRTVKIYDPETDTMERVADMETKRDNCGVTVVDGNVFVTGGVSESTGPSLNSAERYCPVLDKWEPITPLPRRLYRHGSVSIRIPVYRRERTSKKKEEKIKESNQTASNITCQLEENASHNCERSVICETVPD